ncbi:hypothetical protein H072_3601 [Dactylellina haptotyla CBS 200.50]|uniref:Acyltransferase 3 domain-containing protein n=1 Tax=Dactylellina haptotyla (strain CBS 200.50) TaxID=1284197 RepID=S8AHR9_DACHA|nr:hypothetical protein H072_3601 [Dactylellina haptotyla CBS 200.50]
MVSFLTRGSQQNDEDYDRHSVKEDNTHQQSILYRVIRLFRPYGYSKILEQTQKETPKSSRNESFLGNLVQSKLWQTLIPIFNVLLPTFISSQYSKNHPSYKLTSTSWLDGLRGIACFIVFIYHSTYCYFASQREVFDGQKNHYFLQLPFIRVLHSGPPMVMVFFIISGFALSYKSVTLMRKPVSYIDSHALLSNIASSIWKRYFRLILPCMGTYVLVTFFVVAGWFETVPHGEKGRLRGVVDPRPPMIGSLYGQIEWAVADFYKFAVPITIFYDWSHFMWETDSHLWTIPAEFQRSLTLFVTIAGLSHLKHRLRMRVFLPCFVLVAMYSGFWEYGLFVFGFFLAEIHTSFLATREEIAPLPLYSEAQRHNEASKILRTVALAIVFTSGLYFCSYPEVAPDPDSTTGFTYLTTLTPPRYSNQNECRFWMGIGAMLLCFSIVFLPKIQSILCWKLFQYLGRISFSLYLVHGTIIRSMGYAMVHWGWKQFGVSVLWQNDSVLDNVKDLENRRALIVIVGFIITIPVTVWIADIFWRVVDSPSVKFVKWLESKLVRS